MYGRSIAKSTDPTASRFVRLLVVALLALGASTTTATAAFVFPDPPDGAMIQAGANGYVDPIFSAYWDAGSDGSVGSRWASPIIYFSQYPYVENGMFPYRNWLTGGGTGEAPGETADIWFGRASEAHLLTPGTYFWEMEVTTYHLNGDSPGCCAWVQSPVWSFTVVPAPAPDVSAPAATLAPGAALPATLAAPICTAQQASLQAAKRREAAARARLRKARGTSGTQPGEAALSRALRAASRARANASTALWKCQRRLR